MLIYQIYSNFDLSIDVNSKLILFCSEQEMPEKTILLRLPWSFFLKYWLETSISNIPFSGLYKGNLEVGRKARQQLVDDGLLVEGKFLHNSRPFSYAKLPPHTIRLNSKLLERLNFYNININEYEQAYEHFHIPVQHKLAPSGIQLLIQNLDFVPFYHRYHQTEVIDEIEKMKLSGVIKQVGFRYFIADNSPETTSNQDQTDSFFDGVESRKPSLRIKSSFSLELAF